MSTSFHLPPIATHPFRTCIMMSIKKEAQEQFRATGRDCRQIWSNAHHEAPGVFKVPAKGLHVTLATFVAQNPEQIARIEQAVRTEFGKYSEFTVKPDKKRGIKLCSENGKNVTPKSKDYVVCQVKVANQGQNTEHELLMKLEKAVREIIVQNGGTPTQSEFIPHVTIGKITTPGHNEFPIDQVKVGELTFPLSAKHLIFSTHPRAPAGPSRQTPPSHIQTPPPPQHTWDPATRTLSLNESPKIVRIKCGILAVTTPVLQVAASVVHIALRIFDLLTFARFHGAIFSDQKPLSFKATLATMGKDLLSIVATPLAIVGLELAAIYGLFRPFEGKKWYERIEVLLYSSLVVSSFTFEKQGLGRVSP